MPNDVIITKALRTAVGSLGYFASPLYTNYSLNANGWEQTLSVFMFFLIFGLIVSYFVRSPSLNESPEKTSDQTVIEAL